VARIAILLSGGGAPAAECAARAAAAAAAAAGAEALGVRGGVEGLLAGRSGPLDGTPLEPGVCAALRQPGGPEKAVEALKAAGIDALILVGGEGTMQAAKALTKAGAKALAIPAAVENDVPGTDACVGVDTALNEILRAVEGTSKPTLVDVPGRLTGYLALAGAALSGAAGALLVERPFPWERLRARLDSGARPVLLRAEGSGTAADAAKGLGERAGGGPAEVLVLDRACLRARPASAFDRLAALRLGTAAAEAALGGLSGRMIAWRSGRCVPVPLEEAAGRRRQVVPELFEVAKRAGVLFE
jgi:6-phosphofructokinase 1